MATIDRNKGTAANSGASANAGAYVSPYVDPLATTVAGTTGGSAAQGANTGATPAAGTSSSTYVPLGTWNDQGLAQQDKNTVEYWQNQWATANAAGDQSAKDYAHMQAELIRAQSGYSGGSDGSQYIGVPTQGPTKDMGYQASQLPSASSQESYINDLYAAQREAALAALKSAYDQNIINVDAAAAKIPETYQAARNQTAASSQQQQANWNEYAAASGLNVGTGAQGNLAMNNQLLGTMGNINTAQANATNDLETERLRIQTQYQNAIAQAVAEGDLAKAQSLYQEAVRVDESLVATARAQADENYRAWTAGQSVQDNYYGKQEQYAATLAQFGDFSGYKALGYTDAQIAQMQAYWQAVSGGSLNNSGVVGGGGGNNNNTSPTNNDTVPSSATGNKIQSYDQARGLLYEEMSANGYTKAQMSSVLTQMLATGQISQNDYNMLSTALSSVRA